VRKQSETECDMRSTNLINCLSIRHRIRTNTCFVAPIDFYDMESNNCTFSFSVLRTPSNFITDPSVPCMCGYVCMYVVCVCGFSSPRVVVFVNGCDFHITFVIICRWKEEEHKIMA